MRLWQDIINQVLEYNMSLAIRLLPEPLRSIAFGSISGAYAGIGPIFVHPSRILLVQNFTDAILTYSFDGLVDHFQLPPNGFLLLDVTTNQVKESGFFIAQGTRIYVKGTPSLGQANVSTFYGYDGA